MIKDENNNHNMMGVKPVADVVIETGGGSGGKKDPGHTNKPSLFKLRMQGCASVTPPLNTDCGRHIQHVGCDAETYTV